MSEKRREEAAAAERDVCQDPDGARRAEEETLESQVIAGVIDKPRVTV